MLCLFSKEVIKAFIFAGGKISLFCLTESKETRQIFKKKNIRDLDIIIDRLWR